MHHLYTVISSDKHIIVQALSLARLALLVEVSQELSGAASVGPEVLEVGIVSVYDNWKGIAPWFFTFYLKFFFVYLES